MPTRTDPPVSEAQRRAMWAASEGRGNIGIPRSVGKEFAEADPGGKLPEHAKADAAIGARRDAASSHLRTHADCAADGLRDHPAMRADEWSEEARKAAAEARKRGSGGLTSLRPENSEKLGKETRYELHDPRGVSTNQVYHHKHEAEEAGSKQFGKGHQVKPRQWSGM